MECLDVAADPVERRAVDERRRRHEDGPGPPELVEERGGNALNRRVRVVEGDRNESVPATIVRDVPERRAAIAGLEQRVEEALEPWRWNRQARVGPRLVDGVEAEKQPARPPQGADAL